MKKILISAVFAVFMVSTFAAGDIPFFKRLFIGDEKYVRQELLKCKDVKSVEFEIAYKDDDDLFYDIHVYLTNHRFISFNWVDLGFYKSSQTNLGDYIRLKQINDFAFGEQSFIACRLGKDSFAYSMHENFGEIRCLEQLLPELKVSNMLEIIENIDDVYNFIKNLPEKPEDSSNGIIEFEGFYEKPFEIPEDFDNGIPVTVIFKRKVKLRKDSMSREKELEEGYRFYKYPIKNANNNGFYRYITDY